MLKTWYEGHDEVYKRNREKGLPGWTTEQEITETRNHLKRFLHFSKVPKTGKVIEFGCGSGDTAIFLSQAGYETFGIDISETAIEWAREKANNAKAECHFTCANVIDLKDFSDETFSIAFDGLCLHCLIGNDRQKFLNNVYRVLKPDSFFMVRTMCGDPKSEKIKQSFDITSRTVINNGFSVRYLGLPQDIENEIKNAGFKIEYKEIIEAKTDTDQDELIIYAGKL